MPCGATNSGLFFALLVRKPEINLTTWPQPIELNRPRRHVESRLHSATFCARASLPSLVLKPFLRKQEIGEMSVVFAVKNCEDRMPHFSKRKKSFAPFSQQWEDCSGSLVSIALGKSDSGTPPGEKHNMIMQEHIESTKNVRAISVGSVSTPSASLLSLIPKERCFSSRYKKNP